MSAFSRVWRRAPLWRLCLFGAGSCLVLSVLYPTSYLAPLVGRVWPGHGVSAQSISPAAPAVGNTPDSAAPPVPSGPSGTFLPLSQTLTGAVPFSGYALPLPAGEWHPVLSINTHSSYPLINTVYARTDRGVVTGLITTAALIHAVPLPALSDIDSPCHDDRSFDRGTIALPNSGTTCWATSPFFVHDTPNQNDDPLAAAIQRLHDLGYPIPPMMLATIWRQTTVDPHGMANVVSVVTLISPTQPGTTTMLAPLDGWTADALRAYPTARTFLDKTIDWTHNWTALLAQSRGTTPLDPAHIPAAAIHDPAAP